MNDELIEYFNVKFILCFLYNDEMYQKVLDGNYDQQILNYGFLYFYKNMIENIISLKMLDDLIKDRVYKVLHYIKDNLIACDTIENKNIYINLINELIVKLNTSESVNCNNFYINEITKRFGDRIIFTEPKFEKLKNKIIDSLCYDYLFLFYHITQLDDETFEQLSKEMVMDEYYFASLNAILSEFPELFEIETFKKRVKRIIELNKRSKGKVLDKNLSEKIFILKNNRKFDKMLKN